MNHEELGAEEAQIIAEYSERYKPHPYRKVFSPPVSGDWKPDAHYVDGYLEAARLLLEGIAAGRLSEGQHGVAAVYLCRHYLELEIKYTLFHSRWLKQETKNAADSEITPVAPTHNLQSAWDALMKELKAKAPSILKTGLDLTFVSEFVAEFHGVDPRGWRFRYPRERIAVEPRVEPASSILGIDFEALLSDLKRVHDVLDTLDSLLVNQYGENEEWESVLNDL
jgi:hypothetical protein